MTEPVPAPRPTSWLDVRAWVATRVRERSVLVSGLTVVLAWVASVIGLVVSADPGPAPFLVGAVVVLGLLVALLEILNVWAKRQAEEAQRGAAARLGVAVKDAFRPVAELVAQMPAARPPERTRLLYQVSQQVASGLYLLFEVPGVRAVVYRLDGTGTVLTHLAYHGRGETPAPLRRHAGEEDQAFEALVQNRTRVVDDVGPGDGQRPGRGLGQGGAGAGAGPPRGYRSYVAVPVVTGVTPYGLLTVDAPEPSSFTETDVAVTEFAAELLAVAFAVEATSGVVGGSGHDRA